MTMLQLRVVPPPYFPTDLVVSALTSCKFITINPDNKLTTIQEPLRWMKRSKQSSGRSPTSLGASDDLWAAFGVFHFELKECVAGLKGRQEVWFDSTGEMTSFMAQTRRSLSQQSSFEFHIVLQYC
ncbi:hypothetical protein M422DRAFT_243062 [Sphaerobolus stellatus SS14]|nr:hypothetical protein M422DRAFT_243062 [Sphaerobolus stellatus SS14]